MSCYMTGFGSALFLSSFGKGTAPKKKRNRIGGEDDGLYGN